MSKNLITKDSVTGVFAVALGAIYLAATLKIPLFDAGDEVGPRAFPYIIATMVIGCGLALLAKEFFNESRSAFSLRLVADRHIWLRIGLIAVAGIIYGLVLDWLGYLIATIIFLFFVGELINVRRHLQNLLIACGFSLVTFVVFALILKLSLPRGILGAVLPF